MEWSRDEVEAIADDYFSMLTKELVLPVENSPSEWGCGAGRAICRKELFAVFVFY